MAEETKKAAASPKKVKKAGKPSLFKRFGAWLREYRSELKKVVWYPKKDVVHDTGVVVVALAICGLLIGVLDLIFTKLILLLGTIA